jgi:hypothetical protein
MVWRAAAVTRKAFGPRGCVNSATHRAARSGSRPTAPTGATLKHNFTVASGPTFPERIFQVPDVAGTHTFDIPALPAGSYFFICTIHPESMTGTLIIK